MRHLSLFILIVLFFNIAGSAAERMYTINLSDWPTDIAEQLAKVAPEISQKEHTLESLNTILKKIDRNMNFNSLKFVRLDSSSEVRLVGEISPIIQRITFNGLTDINEPDALNLMGLNMNNILEESNLNAGIEKLSDFYRQQGYRFARVTYEIVSESTIRKVVVFNIDKKQKTRLVDIQLEGLKPTVVMNSIQHNLKRNFRRATLNQETLNKINTKLRNLLSVNGYYMTPAPSPQIVFAADELSARLIYRLSPEPRYYIEVVNSRRFEHNYLEEDILKLDTYIAKDDSMAADLVERLKEYYISEGYPHIEISYQEVKREDRIHLLLNVEEGPFTKIADLKITGQLSRDENFYKEKFYDLSSAKVQDKIYLKEDIELAAKNLLIYLQNDGYVSAKLSRLLVTTEKENPERGIVVIQIDEGPQVQIASVEFNGVSPGNAEPVRIAANLTPGNNLSLIQLEASLAAIKQFYQQQGYIEYRLKNEDTTLIQYTEDNTKAALFFDIAEGPRVQVQSILIEGNTRTKDKLILLELDFKVGDVLNPDNIEESVARLQRTGHFNSVEITTLEKDTSIAQRTVIIRVAERDPGVRVLGFGVTDENRGTLHGYTGIAYRNFFGWGVGLSARAELNYNFANIRYLEQKYTFGFVWPYLFETRARFRTSATRSNTIGDITINKVTEANIATFSLEQDFTSHFIGILSYSVSTYKDHGITNEDEIKYGYSSESIVIGAVGPTLDIDYRDNLFNPTSGSFSRLAAEYATEFLGNNNVDDFYRLTGQTTFYFPFSDSGIVYAQSLRGGYIKDFDDKGEGVPFDKKGFVLGGRTTIRGFESAEFFPSTQELGASYRLNTSSSYELVKSELRFPLSFKYDVAGAVFYDGGQVRIEGVELESKWRNAVGFGIRYNTPVGPLNLEYGHKLDKKSGESDGAFHLSVGIF